jgi:hypothetical protein
VVVSTELLQFTFATVFGEDLIYTANRREEGVFISHGKLALGNARVDFDKSYIFVFSFEGFK